jgi:uncharacterized protein YgiM (DUF1202 family)
MVSGNPVKGKTMRKRLIWGAILLVLAILLAACRSEVTEYEATISALKVTIAAQGKKLATAEAKANQPTPSPPPSPTRDVPSQPTVILPSPKPVSTIQRPPTATPPPPPTATPTASPTPTPIPDAAVGATVTNLRSGPGVGFDVLSEVESGTPLEILGKSADGEWVKVRTPDQLEGWMFYLPLVLNISLDQIPVIQ